MFRTLRPHSLGLFFGLIFILAVLGQAIAGHADFNHQALAHHGDPISLGRYLVSSSFGTDLLENWQSEYLQFTLYILLTVWFIQRGSPESKQPGTAGRESDEEQKVGAHAGEDAPRWARVHGWRRKAYENSLVIVMSAIWLGSWAVQSITGRVAYNAEQFDHQLAGVSWLAYLGSSDFWDR